MQRRHRASPWCRYADDGLVHCRTEREAQQLMRALTKRFAECGLEIHPAKSKIVYCKDNRRKGSYQKQTFCFLGYEFRARACRAKDGSIFTGFTPAVSKESTKAMTAKIRKERWGHRTERSIEQIAKCCNPMLQGWLNYYGRYTRSALNRVWRQFNRMLVKWSMRKYKKLRKRKTRAVDFLTRIAKGNPHLFVHWRVGMIGSFI